MLNSCTNLEWMMRTSLLSRINIISTIITNQKNRQFRRFFWFAALSTAFVVCSSCHPHLHCASHPALAVHHTPHSQRMLYPALAAICFGAFSHPALHGDGFADDVQLVLGCAGHFDICLAFGCAAQQEESSVCVPVRTLE